MRVVDIYNCESNRCYQTEFKVNGTLIHGLFKSGGELGENYIQVSYSYGTRRAEGSGECNDQKIRYNYIFTEGPPAGAKGIALVGSSDVHTGQAAAKLVLCHPQPSQTK